MFHSGELVSKTDWVGASPTVVAMGRYVEYGLGDWTVSIVTPNFRVRCFGSIRALDARGRGSTPCTLTMLKEMITDRRVIRLQRMKKLLRCDYCKPNKGENINRNCKYWKKHTSWKMLKKKQYGDSGVVVA